MKKLAFVLTVVGVLAVWFGAGFQTSKRYACDSIDWGVLKQFDAALFEELILQSKNVTSYGYGNRFDFNLRGPYVAIKNDDGEEWILFLYPVREEMSRLHPNDGWAYPYPDLEPVLRPYAQEAAAHILRPYQKPQP